MKIGLIICDHLRTELAEKYGSYQTMFHQVLSDAANAISIEIEIVDYWAIDNQFPKTTNECDVYLVTGSQFSVNDTFDWVLQLKSLVKNLYLECKPLLGICYGHQMIAAALDGEVKVSDKGWGIGVTEVKIVSDQTRYQQLNGHLKLRVSHKEQIVKLPSNTQRLASNQFCENFMIQTGNCFLGIQGHPEFSRAYAKDLILCRESIIPPSTVKAGIQSLEQAVDNQLIMQIALGFLQDSMQ